MAWGLRTPSSLVACWFLAHAWDAPPPTQIALALGVGLGVGLQPREQASSVAPRQPISTFALTQKKPLLLTQAAMPPQAPPYDGVGDQAFYSAETFYEDDTKAGYLVGMFTTIVEANSSNIQLPDLPQPNGGFDVRITNVFFHFMRDGSDSTAGDQIAVNSQTAYPDVGRTLAKMTSHRRAIVGGTGRYFGATGQVTTTLRLDGDYTQTFQYILPNVDLSQL